MADRRAFLKALAATGVAMAPGLRAAPSDSVRVGIIGAGLIGPTGGKLHRFQPDSLDAAPFVHHIERELSR